MGCVKICSFIVDPVTNQRVAMLGFCSEEYSRLFVEQANGRLFSEGTKSDASLCHCVFVSSVLFMPFLGETVSPIDHHSLLPSCPRCLERIDPSISGIVTHTVSKWPSISCIVCTIVGDGNAHTEHPMSTDEPSSPPTKPSKAPSAASQVRIQASQARSTSREVEKKEKVKVTCQMCGTGAADGDTLWVCLICAFVGCGRYQNTHMVNHFEQTLHRFTVDVQDGYVWDYEGDGYVHRLAQRMEHAQDRFVVCGASSDSDDDMGDPAEENDMVVTKIESVATHYNHLLNSQLEEQYVFYTKKLQEAHRRIDKEVSQVEKQLESEEKPALDELAEWERIHKQSLKDVKQEQDRLEAETKQLGFLQGLNTALVENKNMDDDRIEKERVLERHEKQMETIRSQRDRRIAQLEKQLNEVMLRLSRR